MSDNLNRYDQFKLTYQSENDWFIMGWNESESWDKHYLRRKGNKFFVGRKRGEHVEYSISSTELLLTIYNYFVSECWGEEEKKRFLRIATAKGELKAAQIKKALEINQTGIRQICLQKFWALQSA